MNRLIGSMMVCSLSLAAGFAAGSPAWKFTLQNAMDGTEILSTAGGEGILLASTRNHGVFQSSDTGRTWRPDGAGTLRLHILDFDSATHLFYGLGDSALYCKGPQAAEWIRLTTFVADPHTSPPDYSSAGFIPTSDLSVHGRLIILLRAQSSGVMVSRDGGGTWRTASFPTVGLNILSVLAADSCVYASDMDSPVSVSCDGGATWRHSGGDSVSHYGYGLARHRGSVLVASGYGVYRSETQGRTWIPWNRNLQDNVEPGNSGIKGLKARGNSLYAHKWIFHGSASQQTLYRSTDGGSSWTAITGNIDDSPTVMKPAAWMDVAEMGNRLFVPSWRGLLHNTDVGTAWNRVRVLGDAPVLSLSVRGSRIVALTGSGLFLTTDSGTTWNTALRSDSTSNWSSLSGSARLYAVLNRQGGIRVSEDTGATWKPIPVPAAGPARQAAVLGGDVHVLTAGALWRSRPDGSAWTRIALPAEDSIALMAGGDRSLLLCARTHVWEYHEDGSFRDRSATLPSFDIPRAWVAGGTAYVVSLGELHGWEASAGEWRRISGYSGYPYTLAGQGSGLLLSTNSGHQVSVDGGRTWQDIHSTRKPWTWQPYVFALDGNQIYAGDDQGGIWMLNPALPEPPTSNRDMPGRASPGRGAAGARRLLEAMKIRFDGRVY